MKGYLKLRSWIQIENIHFYFLIENQNRNAISILEENLDKFNEMNWITLSKNPNAIHMLEKNLDKISWCLLSLNENAIHILEKNLDKINWYNLSINKNAIPILEENLDKIDWSALSSNINAIHILENNLDKVDWRNLSENPNIFTYDYQVIKDHFYSSGLAEEIIANRFHPKNMDKWNSWGFEFEDV